MDSKISHLIKERKKNKGRKNRESRQWLKDIIMQHGGKSEAQAEAQLQSYGYKP